MIKAAIYLAHLNPMTKAHESIISMLQKEYQVYIFPVRFLRDGKEINTRSFPFSYELRKQMVEAVFGNSVVVLPNYTFHVPFIKYMPPLLSSRSWDLRNQIIAQIKEDKFVSYTGDKAERMMLKLYKLNPLKADRLEISASAVKDELYRRALEGTNDKNSGWQSSVPVAVANIINKNWEIVEKFSRIEDNTIRIMGMKFPREGYKS